MLQVRNTKVYDLKESIIACRNAMRTELPEYTEEEFENIYELMVHNLFFRTYDKFRNAIDGGLVGEKIDCKKYLEDYFNVKL